LCGYAGTHEGRVHENHKGPRLSTEQLAADDLVGNRSLPRGLLMRTSEAVS